MRHSFFDSLPVSQIPIRFHASLVCALVLCVHVFPESARADLVKLLHGGELRGKVIQGSDDKQKIRLETLTGAIVVVERDQTQSVTTRPLAAEEYETRLKHLEDNWGSHWELSEWCRQRALSKQRETHLRRVTELAPDHEKAQLALGRVWHQASWVDRDELMASQGFVKYRNKYVTRQELDVIERTSNEADREKNWFQKVRLWHGWLSGPSDERRRKAMTELTSISDPNAATAIIKFLSSDVQTEIRELSVVVLIRISGGKAAAGLAKMALFDDSAQVRSAALEGLSQGDVQQAQNAFIKALKSDYNTIVCRAANALAQIGDKSAVDPLINALITVHSYQVEVPNNQTLSFTTDGNFASNSQSLPPSVTAAMRSGQMLPPIVTPSTEPVPKKTVTVSVDHYNVEVLSALEKLTKKNFAYDKRAWGRWRAIEKNQGSKAPK